MEIFVGGPFRIGSPYLVGSDKLIRPILSHRHIPYLTFIKNPMVKWEALLWSNPIVKCEALLQKDPNVKKEALLLMNPVVKFKALLWINPIVNNLCCIIQDEAVLQTGQIVI